MPARNAIGFLRFFFAVLVIFSHSYPLGGFGTEILTRAHMPDTFGGFAVAGFFVLSGMLIAQSWTRSHSLGRFLWHRVLRIFPGYWVCLLVTVLGFAPLVMYLERGSLHGYWSSPVNSPLDYLRHDALLTLKQMSIANLLENNPAKYTFDGSLWTLAYEFLCYLGVAVLGIAGLLQSRLRIGRVLVLVGLAVCIAVSVHPEWATQPSPFDAWLFRLAAFFLAGVAFHQWKEHIVLRADLGIAALVLTVVAAALGAYRYVAPLSFGYFVLWLAAALPIKDFDKRGDFSYGVYIYAYPVQQVLALVGWQRHGVVVFFLTALALTLPLAVASFYLVERPCMRWKNVGISKEPARI